MSATAPDCWISGDGTEVRPKLPPGKVHPEFRKGFRAGIAAMLVALARSSVARVPVHGAAVYVLADHHVDEAALAAASMLKAAKSAGGES